MTSPCARPTALSKKRVQAVLSAMVAACALSVLTACSGQPARVELPAKPATATTAVSREPASATAAVSREPASATPRQQVVAALTGYTAALGRAEKSRSLTMARRLLRPYLAASRLGGMVGAVSRIWARGERFYGDDVLHIIGMRIDGHRAFVHDCDDTSAMGLAEAATGQAVPGSAGVEHANLVTRLDQVAGHWLVESQVAEGVPCAP